jgi:cytochrome c oxidase subunit 4
MTTEREPSPGPSAATYVVVWLGLSALAGLSLLASYASLGGWNVVVAFAIATVKAALVLGFFMHLMHGRPLHRVVIAVAFGFVVMIVLGVMADVGTRDVAGPDLPPPVGRT